MPVNEPTAVIQQAAAPTPQPVESTSEHLEPGIQEGMSLPQALAWAGVAIACFHLAYGVRALCFLIVGYMLALAQLTRARTLRMAGWVGFGVGFLTAAPQLTCFWTLFGPGAIGLWSVLGFWIGLFVVLGRFVVNRLGMTRGWVLLPFVWTGVEYFRSELYLLKFSWLNVGYCLSGTFVQPVLHYVGVYGAGFLAMGVALASARVAQTCSLLYRRLAVFQAHNPEGAPVRERSKRGSKALWIGGASLTLAGFVIACVVSWHDAKPKLAPGVQVAGVQLEFPTEAEVIAALDQVIAQHPETELLMLSEYTFMDGSVPQNVRNWCREHHKYLLAGGKHLAKAPDFYDTAFVVGTNGDIIFEQGKSVPVQFMKDGLPATSQRLWQSPWGKIGICICYDLSYTRVTDRLVQLGAQALLIPTMDVVDWGLHEHELHARVAPVRAIEYGIPVFRVASSGISQFVNAAGRTIASAGFPGDHEQIFGTLSLAPASTANVPWDRWLAWLCVAVSAGLMGWMMMPVRVKKERCSPGGIGNLEGN
jgi:apolipoprotein N-acyltransferase